MDGSSDGTAEALRARTFPFPLEVVEQPSLGPAAARNEGARRASGAILLFLDDDMQPDAQVIAAHLALHGDADDRIGIGVLTPVVGGRCALPEDPAVLVDGHAGDIHRPGHRFSFKDLLSGHFSIARSRFGALAGFDTGLRCHEDYELGFRAIQAGMEFRVARGDRKRFITMTAPSTRCSDGNSKRVWPTSRWRAGILRSIGGLPFAWQGHASRKKRALRRVAWSASAAADTLARSLQRTLPMYEAASLRFRWRRLLEALLEYWYWRGIAGGAASPWPIAVPYSRARRRAGADDGGSAPRESAPRRRQLDEFRPAAARLRLGSRTR